MGTQEPKHFEKIKAYIQTNKTSNITMREEESSLTVDMQMQKADKHIVIRYYNPQENPNLEKPSPNGKPLCYKMYFEIMSTKGGSYDDFSDTKWFVDEYAVIECLKKRSKGFHWHGWC